MIFKSDPGAGDLNGFLDSGSRIDGELTFETTFRVDGTLSGKIESEGSLVIGEGGEVDGEIRVSEIFVSGTIRGQIHANRRVHLAATGRVFADLHTPSLIVEDGALFDGHCVMTQGTKGEDDEASGSRVQATSVAPFQRPPKTGEGSAS